jgi:hypothetical protein
MMRQQERGLANEQVTTTKQTLSPQLNNLGIHTVNSLPRAYHHPCAAAQLASRPATVPQSRAFEFGHVPLRVQEA